MNRYRATNGLLVLTCIVAAVAFDGQARLGCAIAAAIAATAGVLHEVRAR